jgi:YHS domain-containing protein
VLRLLAYIFLALVTIGLLRGVAGALGRLFLNSTVGPERAREASKPRGAEELKKDPICGTFVAASAAVRLERKGQVHYFCSTACRDKFV